MPGPGGEPAVFRQPLALHISETPLRLPQGRFSLWLRKNAFSGMAQEGLGLKGL